MEAAPVNVGGPSFEALADDARREVNKYRPKLGLLDERLLALVTAHLESEAGLLAAYRAVAEQVPDEYVRYLTNLIVGDEQRHHQLLSEMANYLRAGTDGSDTRPRVPWLTRTRQPNELYAATAQLVRSERRDRRELRRLRRALRPLRNTSLLSTLVDTMLLDTKKHLLLLRAIQRSAVRRRGR
jgi:hypothetical protein